MRSQNLYIYIYIYNYYYSLKPLSSWGVLRQRESTGFHQSSGKMEDQHYTVSSTNFLSIVGSRANFQVIFAMQSSSPCAKTEKGEKSDCSNYRRITLLSIAGKILARVLLNRLVPTIREDHLPETQCGFGTNGGTTYIVFVLRQLQVKCREQNKGLYVVFVDLTKAFDTVSRKGTVDDHDIDSSPPKVPQHGYPTAQTPERPS